jgi:hypothetical protein
MKRWLNTLFPFIASAKADTPAMFMDAVIISSHVTGIRKESREEVMLLLEVMPRNGRHYIIQHAEFVHPHDILQLLQIGHKVNLFYSMNKEYQLALPSSM